jgi:2,3-bisphosphoglycerate-independent phosphoglycerate mutase
MTKPIKCKVVYNKDNITETLGEVLEKQTKLKLELQRLKSILTLLFRWTRREPFIGESRILKTLKSSYLRFTEMSAFELTDALIPELEKRSRLYVLILPMVTW